MKFSIIAAIDNNLGIGINNRLPWDLKADLKHFAEITIGQNPIDQMNAVIMGQNTWHSLPEKFRPLKNRLNIVLSQEALDLPAGVLNFHSLDDALAFLDKQSNMGEAFIIGGAYLYKMSITHPACNKLYLTKILGEFDCDAFFPEIPDDFKMIEESPVQEENGIRFKFTIWKKD